MATYNQSQMTLPSGDVVKFIDNTSGYTKNTGTITKVTAGTGLSGGGTSGTVTLNHSNSVTAQTTQAVYPIKIDAQGHISAYGAAVTIPAAVTESTVSGWGFTKNAGTITGIKMNGASKGTSGVVDLGTVITSHQDISGKVDKINITAQNTQAVYPIKINAQGQISAYGSAVTIPIVPVDSVNGKIGAVVLNASDVGALASNTTYVSTVNGSSGAVTITVPTKTSDLNNDSGFLISAVTTFNGRSGAVTYSAPVSSVNGQTGAVTGLQTTANLVTSVSSSSTDSQYPSAKCLYDMVGNIETLLASI